MLQGNTLARMMALWAPMHFGSMHAMLQGNTSTSVSSRLRVGMVAKLTDCLLWGVNWPGR
eukprot:scaffold3763_cov25-Tisochrysis_lutea.AAC.2